MLARARGLFVQNCKEKSNVMKEGKKAMLDEQRSKKKRSADDVHFKIKNTLLNACLRLDGRSSKMFVLFNP